MSDDFDEPNETDNPNIKQLREQANRSRDLEKQLNELQRENAFAKAGIDLGEARNGYFVRGYDGELDPTKIREAAEQAGFLGTREPPAADPVSPQERVQMQRIDEATAGGESPPPDPTHVEELQKFARENRGMSPDEFTKAMASFLKQQGELDVQLGGEPYWG